MTPEQAKKLIQLAFYQQSLATDMVTGIDPDLKATLRIIAGKINTLPEAGNLLRESAWRQMKPQIMKDLDRFAGKFGESVISVLREGAVKAEEFSRGFIELGVEGATQSGQVVTARSSVSVGLNQPAELMFINNQDIPVTVGRTYFKAIAETDVVGQNFTKLFGKSVSEQGGILSIGTEQTGIARFYMTSIDRVTTEGILKGETTKEIADNLISESFRGLNLGKTGRQLRTQAMTVARTATANALNRAHEAFWDANDKWEWTDEAGNTKSGNIIKGWIFDAVTDSRACPTCTMLDQRFAKKRDDLPSVPVHPRCRCVRRPVTASELQLMRDDAKDGTKPLGSAIELYEAKDLPGRKRGESPKDFIKRKQRLRRAQNQQGKDTAERWYATPIKKDGKTFYRMARDLPTQGKAGVIRVPEWLGQGLEPKLADRPPLLKRTTDATRIDFFGGGVPGELRNIEFKKLIKEGDTPRQAMVKLLTYDKEDGFRRYRFKPSKTLANTTK